MKKFILLFLLFVSFTFIASCGGTHTHNYLAKHNEMKHWDECSCGDIKNLENHKGGTATETEKAKCEVCNTPYGDYLHTHTGELKHDDYYHWYECSCGAIEGKEIHKGGTATETEKAKCEVCNTPYGELLVHKHNYELKTDENYHWQECSCGDSTTKEKHTGGNATTIEYAKCETCGTEYGELHKHEYSENYISDETCHWKECDCGLTTTKFEHSGGTATTTELAKCEVCNAPYGELHKHNYELKFNETGHWNECVCGDTTEKENHKGGSATTTELAKCEVCNASYGELHKHNYELKFNETEHWNECLCGDTTEKENHKGGSATTTELAKCETCNAPYGELHKHNYELKNDDTYHWTECLCGDATEKENHKGGTATTTELAKCEVCNTSYGELHKHNYELKFNETEHWTECLCGDATEKENHKGGTATTTELAKCETCNAPYGELHKHNYELKFNETEHWTECLCGDTTEKENHKGGTATTTELAKCEVCNTSYGELHKHNYELKFNETEHWTECLCGDTTEKENHKGGTATTTEKAKCEICNTSYGELHKHSYSTIYNSNDNEHWRECACGATTTKYSHVGGTATTTEKAKCTVCGASYGELHKHQYSSTYESDENGHWRECACGETTTKYNHVGGTATTTEKAKCNICGVYYGDYAVETEHKHSYELKTNNAEHWSECRCGNVINKGPHTGGTATTTEQAICEVCNISYGELHIHEYSSTYYGDETGHWKECSCGIKTTKNNHVGGTATTTEKAKCSLCGIYYGELHAHKFSNDFKTNETHHWKECSCGERKDEVRHYGGTATTISKAKCEACNKTYGELHTHNYITASNNTHHWQECSCGDTKGNGVHYGGTATTTELALCEHCKTPYGELHKHSYSENYLHNIEAHWKECSCGDVIEYNEHNGGTATTTQRAICNDCGVQYGKLHTHTYELKYDNSHHWQGCSCGEIKNKETHTGGHVTTEELAICDSCKQPYGKLHEHNYVITSSDTTHWGECSCGDTTEEIPHFGGSATHLEYAKCEACNTPYGNLLELYSETYEESIEEFANPDRGFYQGIYIKYKNPELELFDKFSNENKKYLYSNNLLHIRIELSGFTGKLNGLGYDIELTQTMINDLDKIFKAIDDSGACIIPRFAYTYDDISNMEADLNMIMRHIEQFTPLLNKYKHMITAIECGLFGQWGEMHSSEITKNPSNFKKLFDKYLSCLDEDIQLLVRQPIFIYEYYYGIPYKELKNRMDEIDFGKNRLGCFNDGYLGSSSDYGTFRNREVEVLFLEKLAKFSYGGEVTTKYDSDTKEYIINEYNYLWKVVDEMFTTNLSYLNSGFNRAITNDLWKNNPYGYNDKGQMAIKNPDPLYLNNGSTDYLYISNHMGYRFVCDKLEYTISDNLWFKLEMRNVGFGELLKEKTLFVILKNGSNEYVYEFKYNNELTIEQQINIHNLPSGNYEFYFVLADEYNGSSLRGIRCGNTNMYNSSMAANKLAEFIKQ